MRHLAALSVTVGGTIGLSACAYGVADMWVPFVRSEGLKCVVVPAVCLVAVAIGVGLWLMSRTAWYAFLACVALGTAWVAAGSILDPFDKDERWFFAALFGSIGGLVGVVAYFVTRSAFVRGEDSSCRKVSEKALRSPPRD